ncbi:hypothetical protein DPMN_011640 [Dreissena polymorpha]|uniref:Uncharacterized protein n=1 Tax=Dreissena polymorpha TaxID=45954 RepID=A0A9D4N6I5_DREPO|nr:hypothetical protein DPMN_011640 [Dreissena polymorpha]
MIWVRFNEKLKNLSVVARLWSTDARRPPTDHLSRSRSNLPRLWSHDGVVRRLRLRVKMGLLSCAAEMRPSRPLPGHEHLILTDLGSDEITR